MGVAIDLYLKEYVEKLRISVDGVAGIESSKSGFYRNEVGGVACVSFYPEEVDLTIEIDGDDDFYSMTVDLVRQSGAIVIGDIFKFKGKGGGLRLGLDNIFFDLVKLISSHL
ncbi:hypothetical protein [Burkholderia sp. S-53]|uniref:hypothetical protein n=1 Tax=Burkholderia sp. S-53 TaxID=2906514 RepID=UPI0021D29D67|nr:hypothetical protein [Burkholderia sp. S-53]UXU90156.1 hypothetical protein LXM88_33130 [Burkholderia sp. S-53]